MKIAIVGAGALGLFFAGRLANAGHDVSVVARGETLPAIRQHGVRLHSSGRWSTSQARSSDNAHDLGIHDLVVLAVKAPSLAHVSTQISGLLGPRTTVVPALNGIPWWFSHGPSGLPVGQTQRDLAEVMSTVIDPASIVGCVAYPSCSSPEPGVTVHASGNRIVLGEASSFDTARATELADIFRAAGFEAAATDDIRTEVWRKLLGNICFNPVSLLVGASTDKLIDDVRTRSLFTAMMNEMLDIADALGIQLDLNTEDRIALTRRLGPVKTSMLQDAEAERPVEVEAIIGAVVEIAEAAELDIPCIRTVYALAHQRAEFLGLLPR